VYRLGGLYVVYMWFICGVYVVCMWFICGVYVQWVRLGV
jgi:hypothetical protein